MRKGSLANDAWKVCAVPEKLPCTVLGMRMRCCICWIALTASLNAMPPARLKEMVTDGNWPWLLTAIGAFTPLPAAFVIVATGSQADA